MQIKITREVQRRQYTVEERDGRFFTSLLWDDSARLNRPFQAIPFTYPHISLEAAQASACHLPGPAEWTRTDAHTWATQVFISDNSGGALTPPELDAVRRQVSRSSALRIVEAMKQFAVREGA